MKKTAVSTITSCPEHVVSSKKLSKMKLFAILAAVQAYDEELVSVFDTKCTNIGKSIFL